MDKEYIKINTFYELFFRQLMTFSNFMNDSPEDQRIEDEKYADAVLYCMKKELDRCMDEKGIEYPKNEEN